VTAPEDRPWTLAEAAEWLQRDPETVRRWARAKPPKLPGEKLGSEWRFHPDDVRALIPRAGRQPAPDRTAEDAMTLKAQLDQAYTKSVLRRGRSA
jgi:hypothetical protein